MKKYLDKIPYIVIAILLVIIILMKECKRCPEVSIPDPTVITTTDTIYDTLLVESNVYIPVPGPITYVEIPQDVDTPAILATHFSKYPYNDTLKNDSIAFIAVFDTIYQNKIYNRRWEYKDLTPAVINQTNIIYDTCQQCSQFNLGFGGLIGGYTDKFGVGPSILLTTNKKSSYSLSYDVVNKIAYFGIYWNIK